MFANLPTSPLRAALVDGLGVERRLEVLERQREVEDRDVALGDACAGERGQSTEEGAAAEDRAAADAGLAEKRGRVSPSTFWAASRIAPSWSSSSKLGRCDIETPSAEAAIEVVVPGLAPSAEAIRAWNRCGSFLSWPYRSIPCGSWITLPPPTTSDASRSVTAGREPSSAFGPLPMRMHVSRLRPIRRSTRRGHGVLQTPSPTSSQELVRVDSRKTSVVGIGRR